MKLDGLKGRRRSERPTPSRPSGEPSTRTREQLEHMRTMRFPRQHFINVWSLTDDEIESIYEHGARDLIARGGKVTSDDMSEWHTVQRLGWPCVKNGWSIVPQDRPGTAQPDHELGRGGERRPSKIRIPSRSGGRDFYAAFLPTQWRERRISLREFVGFEHLHGSNLAIQCCAASSHVRAIDIDCPDPEVAARVRELAFQHLGPTPFIRVGNAPKAQLLYRVEGDEDIAIRKWSVTIGAETEEPQSVEFLAEGAIITAYGLHHKTGLNFDWSEGSLHPAIAGPEHAPVITKHALRAFVNSLQDEWPVTGGGVTSNPYGAKASATVFDKTTVNRRDIWTPRVVEGDWTVDDNGDVVDGAERWMTAQSWALCAANAGVLDEVQGYLIEWLSMEGKLRLLSSKRTNAKYLSEESIAREAAHKIRSAALKWRASMDAKAKTGNYHAGVIPWTIGDDGRRPVPHRIKAADRPADGSLDWIPDDACPVEELAERVPRAKTSLIEKTPEQTTSDRDARALIEDQAERRRIGDDVSLQVRAGIGEWLSSVSVWDGEAPAAPWLLKAPTGAGKTVGTIDELARWCRDNPRGAGQGPVLLVLPTHANGDEAMEKAVGAGMFAPELWSERDLDKLEEGLEAVGVKIVRFRGREAAGCQRSEELRMLSSKGIGASRLCGAEVEDGDELDRKLAHKNGEKLPKIELLCPFRERGECGYYNQMSELKTADIVVMPHAYLTISALPAELRKPRAIIVDESVTYALIRQARMPISALSLPRREPYVTKTDRKQWPSWEDADIKAHYIGSREELCSHAVAWLKEGKDVAAELAKLPDAGAMLQAAITMCDRANDRSRKVRPDLTPEDVRAIADEPSGRYILEEIRFWRLVRDRLDRMAAGTARGERDARWQVVEHPEFDPSSKATSVTPHLRLSWRVLPNWSGRPTLLLDASANPRIVSKLFADQPVVREVKAPLHVRTVAMIERTWSNSSFVPPWDATDDQIRAAAETVEQARRLITTTAVLYGHGRVLVGTTIAVREAITGGGWTPPPNADFVHFGALRGLDFAKHHVAAISIGRSEQPISVIDGYRAALTFDDDEPEQPLDILGNGLTTEGRPLFRTPGWRRINMRTGQDVDHLVPSMPRKPRMNDGRQQRDADGNLLWERSWAEELEESWREEEIRQFLGRLRPVYRSIDSDAPPPVWIAVGKILPDDVIVDELVEMTSVLKAWPMAELVRIGGGVLSDNVTPNLPGAQDLLLGRDLKQLAQELPKGGAFVKRWLAPFMHVRYSLASENLGEIRQRSAMMLPGWISGNATDFWMGLSERYGELPDMLSSNDPRFPVVLEGKAKAPDKRDVDRDDARIAELELLQAHRAEGRASEHGRVEFEMRRARDLYSSDSALSDAGEEESVDACASISKSTLSSSTPTPVGFSIRRFGLQSQRA